MQYGSTEIIICDNEYDLGRQSADAVAETMQRLIAEKGSINVIFAAGESQTVFLDELASRPGIDWRSVACFAMDDLWDVRMPEEYTCGYQLKKQLCEKVKPKNFYRIRWNAADPYAEALRYDSVIRTAGPMDILCQGIGTSGHLALNEPGQCSFNDPVMVRVVTVAERTKRQLIADPNFKGLGYIPEKGITMTLPAMLAAPHIFTMVPLALKRNIIGRLLATPEPNESLPASILSKTKGVLYLDRNSYPEAKR